jgi:hypothetical protein
MTEAEAMQQLRVDCAPEIHPTLSNADLMILLRRYSLEEGDYDREGVDRAVADAWAVKTNKASDHHSVSVNGRGLSAEQVKANCEEREKFYRRRLAVHVA